MTPRTRTLIATLTAVVLAFTMSGMSAPSAEARGLLMAAPKVTSSQVPKVTGTLKVGGTLAVSVGKWGPGAVALSYQWKRSGAAISGATAKTYKLTAADIGKPITVSVTGKKSGYTTATKTTAATAKVITVDIAFANCTALTALYPHGVAKPGVKNDMVSGKPRALKGPPVFSTKLYALNTKSDRDKDGIACER